MIQPTIVQILLEIMIAKFISILILPILLRVNLNSIISQMNKLILSIFKLKFKATSTNISLIVPITLYFTILNKIISTNLTNSIQHLMSNFLLLQRNGLSMYFWIINVFLGLFSPDISFSTHYFILSYSLYIVMPVPLLEFSPGLTIHNLQP